MVSPKDRFVTVYGRNPVIEVLDDPSLVVDKVVLAEGVRGHGIGEIIGLARDRGVPLERASAERVKKLAGNGRQDQGVFADVVAPRMRPLVDALDDVTLRRVLLLDGITTPANVGMILRTATAAGIDGVVVPRRGVASIDPMVVKASAGVAFRAPILKVGTAGEAADLLSAAGFHLVGLAADGPSTLFEAEWPEHVCFVLGSETAGVGEEVADRVRSWVSIPMSGGVESLNVSAAAAVVCFELVRRRPVTPARLDSEPSDLTRPTRCVESLDSASSRAEAGAESVAGSVTCGEIGKRRPDPPVALVLRCQVQSAEDGRDVCLYGLDREVQRVGDARVRAALRERRQYLALTRGETVHGPVASAAP